VAVAEVRGAPRRRRLRHLVAAVPAAAVGGHWRRGWVLWAWGGGAWSRWSGGGVGEEMLGRWLRPGPGVSCAALCPALFIGPCCSGCCAVGWPPPRYLRTVGIRSDGGDFLIVVSTMYGPAATRAVSFELLSRLC
jgi:hypothetical protein